MLSAIDIAKYILSKSQPEDGDIISNLKLQKMLYYSQGFHLAIHKKPLFSDEISHWNHGPVVPTVYAIYQKYAASALPIPDDFDVSVVGNDAKMVIDEVLEVYGQFSAWKLSRVTHEEPPWANTEDKEIISVEQMKQYFVTQLIAP